MAPRNPLNIGAVARAMANFAFSRLTVVAPFEAHWREARSAVGAPEVLVNAREARTLAEAISDCSFVAGTGTRTHRKPEQPVVLLPDASPTFAQQLLKGRAALVFGPEKHGLTRDDLSYCHALIEIPTDSRQPSMNLGQAVAVCLYELACRSGSPALDSTESEVSGFAPSRPSTPLTKAWELREGPPMGHRALAAEAASTSGALDRLATLIEEAMTAAGYSPRVMHPANRHDLRLMLRRLSLSPLDTRRMLGLFRRILYRLERGPEGHER